MDLFDLGAEHRKMINAVRAENAQKLETYGEVEGDSALCSLTLPDTPYEEQEDSAVAMADSDREPAIQQNPHQPPADLIAGLQPLSNTPMLVLGVASDILFPAWQQREIAETLKRTGNRNVTHIELGEEKSLFGHDTFLLDLEGVGGAVKDFLN